MGRSQEFVESLASVAENLLVQFDNMLVVDDVEKGRKYCHSVHFLKLLKFL